MQVGESSKITRTVMGTTATMRFSSMAAGGAFLLILLVVTSIPIARATTHADLVKAVTSTCSLVLDSDVKLTADLPDVNTVACTELRIVGECPSGHCKIDCVKKFSFIRNAQNVYLQNLEITQCRSKGREAAPAIYHADRAVIKNCRFTHHVNAGGGAAIVLWEAEMQVEDCVFSHNQGVVGGAILLDSFSKLIATRVVFSHNTAARGGAIENIESNIVCDECSFLHNKAQDAGGAVYLIDEDGTEGTFRNCQFVRNSARRRGGMGGAVYVGRIDPGVKFCHCSFTGNTVTSGKTGRQVAQHVWIDMKAGDIGNVTFCPDLPKSGIFAHPGYNVLNDCIACMPGVSSE